METKEKINKKGKKNWLTIMILVALVMTGIMVYETLGKGEVSNEENKGIFLIVTAQEGKIYDANLSAEDISKLHDLGIYEVQISPCLQTTNPSCCIAIMNVSEDIFRELLVNPNPVYYNASNPSQYDTSEELNLKLVEEAKKELIKLVAEEPKPVELTDPIQLDIK